MSSDKDISLYTAVNSRPILRECLLRSPDIVSGRLTAHVLENRPSASIAYSDALAECTTELAVFTHQDVYLPAGWLDAFLEGVNRLTAEQPDWAVVGVYGVCASGAHVGRLWDVTLGREL